MGPAACTPLTPPCAPASKRRPAQSTCEACHNDKSPHFHGFVYAAMAGFSHPVKK